MSFLLPAFNHSAISRAAEAEVVGGAAAEVSLPVDRSATGGALSTIRIARGEEAPESLRDIQELYDTYFLNSPEWESELAKP